MREQRKIAVILPVGPSDAQLALDTLDSALHYTDDSRIVVVIDDTAPHEHLADRVLRLSKDIAVVPAPARAPGGHGGLWVKIAAGYRWLLERYEPVVIVRLDVDALFIGHGLADRAIAEFAAQPGVGLLGSYRVGADGGRRDWSYAARQLGIETGHRGLRYPMRRKQLRALQALARAAGYVAGEHVLGGAYIHSIRAADEIHARGWFDLPWLASSKLGEDHIMSLLTVAADFRIGDFGRPGDPLALKWRGLPAHPDELLANGKLVTHSVRYWQDLSEAVIRRIFREARANDARVIR